MNKQQLILKYFQKADQLTVRQNEYTSSLENLFLWLTQNDQINKDITSRLLNLKMPAKAKIICHENIVVAGMEEVEYLVKHHTKLSFQPAVKDGQRISSNRNLANISGLATEILAYERTIINFLQRFSGIATQTRRLVDSLGSPPPFIAATRKTPWGVSDKKAVAVGSGLTHRLNLADGILLKDNHLKLTSITPALKTILPRINHHLIEVEVKTEVEALQTLKLFRRVKTNNYLAIMFDNFPAERIKKTIVRLNNDLVIYEASGGINKNNLTDFAQTGVDIISLGTLTHSAQAADLSLEII